MPREKTAFRTLLDRILIIGSLVLVIQAPVLSVYYHYQFVETRYLDGLYINVNADFSVLNASRWIVPDFKGVDFAFEVESGYPAPVNVTYSVNNYTMGTTDWFKANSTQWGEWGYSFHHLTGGQLDGSGVAHYGGYPTPPATKLEAYTYMRNYVINFTEHLNGNLRPWIFFNGHYPYHHYAAEFGADAIGSEIGENIDSYQVMMAFNRGAARQYHLPWFVDFSAWMSGTITDYNIPPTWGSSSGPTYGHSLSMFQRSYTMAYMAGTSRLIAEGGCANLFYNTPDPHGLLPLTPLGEVGRDFAHFAASHPNRGVPYTPVGLLIDELHGSNGITASPMVFNSIPYNQADMMTYRLMDTIFPSCWQSPVNERGALANNEFGDLFDVLLQNASSSVLASYPVIFMSGEIVPRGNEFQRLVDYVENGGTLFANSAYFSSLNAALQERGHSVKLELAPLQYVKVFSLGAAGGNIVAFGPDYDTTRVRGMLRELVPLVSPFVVTTDGLLGSETYVNGAKVSIQQMVNRNDKGWVLTLINNDGITKEPKEAPVIDASKTRSVTVNLNDVFLANTLPTGASLQNITNWMAGDTLLWSRGGGALPPAIEMTLDPGDIAILEFQFA